MRQRVDAFGVAEPELSLLGSNQIEVNLPGVADAERAAKQVGSTAQLFFYDWEANILDANCKTDPTPVNGGQQPITGLYKAVQQAGKCTAADRRQQQRRRQRRASTRSTRSPSKPFANGQPFDSQAEALDGP